MSDAGKVSLTSYRIKSSALKGNPHEFEDNTRNDIIVYMKQNRIKWKMQAGNYYSVLLH